MASVLNVRARTTGRWRLRRLIERHVLIAFFTLAYAFSWTVWLLAPLVAGLDRQIGTWFGLLAPYGPAFAALTLARVLHPQRLPRDRTAARYGWTGATLVAAVVVLWDGLTTIPRSRYPLLGVAMWLLITLMPAWLMWNGRSVRRGVRAVLATLTAWRVSLRWYATALLLMPTATLLGLAILAVLGQRVPPLPRAEPWPDLLPLLVTVFLATLLYGGPLGEEAGWRGFALPRLQARFSPLGASLILSVLWGLWHLPLHLNGFYGGTFPEGLAGIGLRLLSSLGLTILFTWLYNRTSGNLLLMVVLHTAVNNSAGFWLPFTVGTYIMTAVFVAIVISWDRMWLPLPTLRAASTAERAVSAP